MLGHRNTILNHLFTGSGLAAGFWGYLFKDLFSRNSSPSLWTSIFSGGLFGNATVAAKNAGNLQFLIPFSLVTAIAFLGSFFCWMRLLEGTAYLGVLRAERAMVRLQLKSIGYGAPLGNWAQYMIVADAEAKMAVQVNGFTRRTQFSLITYIVLLVMLAATACHFIAWTLQIGIPHWTSCATGWLGALHWVAFAGWNVIGFVMARSYGRCKQASTQRLEEIMGPLYFADVETFAKSVA